MDMTSLEPAAVWCNFAEICAIPHASGNVKGLSCFLKEKAEKCGFKVRQDESFNLRIDRAETVADLPRIILQAHLDMVPQAAPGKEFDFAADPVKTVIRDGMVFADGTTLGADDGIGIAIAMALMTDKNVKGNISAVFTADEETGLHGANALSAEYLDGDILINLDNCCAGKICVGCAGGIRLAFDFDTGTAETPAGEAVRITLSGLPGGHSGECIHQKRGNALQMLARIVENTGIAISSFDGGTVDNAIPAYAEITAVLDGASQKEQMYAAAETMKKELAPEFTLCLKIEPAELPANVWERGFQKKFLEIFCSMPNGVVEFAPEYAVPLTSSNLASLKSTAGKLHLILSARSLDDVKREKHTGDLKKRFSVLAPEVRENSSYPGWKPDKSSVLPLLASELWQQMTGKPAEIEVIHAGLEAGLFAGKNPSLDMISIAPDIFNIHTPEESVSIASTAVFYLFAVELLNKLSSR